MFDKFTLILRWEPDSENICPSSVAKYFTDRGIRVEECSPKLEIQRHFVTKLMKPTAENTESLIEWIGMVATGGDLNPEDPSISSYECDTDHSKDAYLTTYRTAGFYTPEFVINLWKLLRNIAEKKEACSWIGLVAQNFADAPSQRQILQSKVCIPQDKTVAIIMNEKNLLFQCFRSY